MSGTLRVFLEIAMLIVAFAASAGAMSAQDFVTHPPGVLKDNFGSGTADYSSYAPGIRFPIIDFPSRLNSQVRGLGSGALGGDQCDASNYDNVWWDTLCETRSKKTSVPLGCPVNTVHQGVDIRGGTQESCRMLATGRQNLIPVIAVTDGTIQSIATYTVDLWPGPGERFRYLHMNMQGLKVKQGDKVTKGEVIGYMYRDFGKTPTTFHLHFEHWKNISGKGFLPVPVYCDLIVSYQRDTGAKSTMIGSGQRCEGSGDGGNVPIPVESTTISTAEVDSVSSYWTSGGSEVGLIANGASRTFVYTAPAASLSQVVRPGDVLFEGRKDGDHYSGSARVVGDGCGDEAFQVSGPVTAGGLKVELSGTRTQKGVNCAQPGAKLITLTFTFGRRQGEAAPRPTQTATVTPPQTCGPVLNRQQKTELTRNWAALTMYVPWENWHPYIKLWPGLKLGADGRPVDVQIDRLGGSIMAFESDESGIGIWYYWLLVRKNFGKDGIPTVKPTISQIARGIAGDTATDVAVANYVTSYASLSKTYFGRQLGPDEPIDIASPDQLWALGRTMFHHESGRTPLIDRPTFDRGIRFGAEFMAGTFRGKEAYLPTCDTHADDTSRPAITGGDVAEKDRRITELQETNARLLAMISELQGKLEQIAKMAVQ